MHSTTLEPPVDDGTRRDLLLAGAALTLGVAGCGDDAGDTGGDAGDGFPREIRHPLGTTRIPALPERVGAVTDGAELASLLALGVTPVGFGQRSDPLQPWIADAGGGADGIARYPLPSPELDIERMAAWRADLILGQVGFLELNDSYASVSRLAPTIATPFGNWRPGLELVARCIGREAQAARLTAELDERIDRARESAGIRPGTRVDFVSLPPDGQFIRHARGTAIVDLAADLGAEVLDAPAPGETSVTASRERLADLDGDAIVLLVSEGAGLAEARRLPLWRQLPSVRAGRDVELIGAESIAATFDSVLTVPINLRTLRRIGPELAAA